MSVEALFAKGALRVRESGNGPTVGFVWVEASGAGQLQRWLIKKPLGFKDEQVPKYVFEAWPHITNLEMWTAAVGKRYHPPHEWGMFPFADGLWPEEGGLYVVAQSAEVSVEPSGGKAKAHVKALVYPRRAAVEKIRAAKRVGRPLATRATEPVAAPTRAGIGDSHDATSRIAKMPGPMTQIVVPLAWLHQWKPGEPAPEVSQEPIGMCGGFLVKESDDEFFEGEELFLLLPGYARAGVTGILSRWSVKPAGTIKTIVGLRSHIEENWLTGSRCEATACNYYRGDGDSPPPAAFR